jgi:methyl-accepting chemotaxis protein
MADFNDISQQMENLRNELKLIAKDIEIGNVEISRETVKKLEEQLRLLKRQREEAVAKGEIVDDEVEKTKEMLKLNQQLLKDIKDARTATGQMFIKISAAGNEFKSFLGNFSKQYALAEKIAIQYKQIGVDIGMTGKGAKFMEQSFKGSLPAILEMGGEMSDLKNIFTEISDQSGRISTLTKEDAIMVGSISQSMNMTATEAARMTESFMLMGLSSQQIEENILETYKSAQAMGLNATKVIKVLQQNIGAMQSYSFKGGVKGMTEMAKQAVKMRLDVSDVLQMADKFYQPEAAIEAAANLQMLGGDIAEAFGDPFETMYLARNKPEELAKKLGDMTENMMQFNEETGEYEFPAEVRMQLKSAGEQLGINTDKMIEMSRQTSKIKDIKMKFTSVGDDEMKESLASMAKFKDGKFVIETEEFGDLGLDEVTDGMVDSIMKENQTQEENLRDIATNTKVMSQQIENMRLGGEAKVAGLTNIYELTADEMAPQLQAMKEGIGKLGDSFIDKADVFISDMFKDTTGKSKVDETLNSMSQLGKEIRDGTIKAFEDLTKRTKELTEDGFSGGGGTEDLIPVPDMVSLPGSNGRVMTGSFGSLALDDRDLVVAGDPNKLLGGGNNSGTPSRMEFGNLNVSGRIEIVSPNGTAMNMDMSSIKPQIEKMIINHMNGTFRDGGVPSSKQATDYMG